MLYAGLIVVAGAVQGILMFFRRYLAGRLSLDVEYDLRNAMYRHLQRLSFGFYDRHQTGQLMSRATVDLQSVRIFLGYGLIFFSQNVVTVVIVVGRAARDRLAARADRARDLAGDDVRRLPLLAPQPPDPEGRAAARRRRDDARRGEHRRRARREGVRAGGARGRALPAPGPARLRPGDRRRPHPGPLPAAAADACPAWPWRPCCSSAATASSTARSRWGRSSP